MATKETMNEVLEDVAKKLPILLENNPGSRKRSPVDCVAFEYMYRGLDDKNRPTSYHYALCLHPDRREERMGCLLTREEGDGIIVRIRGVECSFQVRSHQKSAAELRQQIAEQEEGKNPF